MTAHDDLDRMLTAWVDDPYTPPAPRYLPQVLDVTRRTRQRRPGMSLERWLPMTITLRRPMTAAPLRLLAVGLSLLLIAGLAIVGASLLPRVLLPSLVVLGHPQGLIAYEQEGAIWVYDPATDESEQVVAEASGPAWSPDGRWLFFWRTVGADDQPMVIDMATPGADPVALSDPLRTPTAASWGPDGLVAVAAVFGGRPGVVMLHAGETAADPSPIDADRQADFPAFRPGASATGAALLLVRERAPGGAASLALLDAGTGQDDSRPYLAVEQVDVSVGPLSGGYFGTWDLLEPRWAPASLARDGALQPIAYTQLHDLPEGVELAANGGFRVHVFDGTTDRVLVGDPEADDEMSPLWDPTGTRIAFLSYESGTAEMPTDEGRLVIMPADGDPAGRLISAPILGVPISSLSFAWSPDGTQLLLVDPGNGGRIRVVDAATGHLRPLSITSDSEVSWGPGYLGADAGS